MTTELTEAQLEKIFENMKHPDEEGTVQLAEAIASVHWAELTEPQRNWIKRVIDSVELIVHERA